MKEGAEVRGLNTAASLWGSAAVGAFAGAGLLIESDMVAAFALGGNTLLRPLVDHVNRRPINPNETEAFVGVFLSLRLSLKRTCLERARSLQVRPRRPQNQGRPQL